MCDIKYDYVSICLPGCVRQSCDWKCSRVFVPLRKNTWKSGAALAYAIRYGCNKERPLTNSSLSIIVANLSLTGCELEFIAHKCAIISYIHLNDQQYCVFFSLGNLWDIPGVASIVFVGRTLIAFWDTVLIPDWEVWCFPQYHNEVKNANKQKKVKARNSWSFVWCKKRTNRIHNWTYRQVMSQSTNL